MRVYVQPYRGEAELPQGAIAWPIDVPLEAFGEPAANAPTDTRCGVVKGSEFETLFAAAQNANQLTPWTSDGTKHGLIFRPLLPDEHTC